MQLKLKLKLKVTGGGAAGGAKPSLPGKVAAVVDVFKSGLSGNHAISMFTGTQSEKEDSSKYWEYYVTNVLLSNKNNKIIHAMYQKGNDIPVCVAIAYKYPSEDMAFVEHEHVASPITTLTDDDEYAQMEMGTLMQDGKTKYLESMKNMYKKEDVFYVAILATSPHCQGKGFGGMMLDYLKQEAIKKKLPMYIEASSENSARLYNRKGYQRIQKYTWNEFDKPDSKEFTVIFMGMDNPVENANKSKSGGGRRRTLNPKP